MKINVVDLQEPAKCRHWGTKILILILLLITGLNTFIAWHNSKPICDDLRPRMVNEYTRTLECVTDLGDIQEDQADVIIRQFDRYHY
jgi:hypothetical protein